MDRAMTPVPATQPIAAASLGLPVVRANIVVIGAGIVGLAAGIALARQGFATCVVGGTDARPNGRTVALLDGSMRLLGALGLRAAVERDAAPMRGMRIIDDTGALLRPPPITFKAREIGLDAFGANIENHRLAAVLADAARVTANLSLIEARAVSFTYGVDGASVRLDDGRTIHTALVVAADGRASAAREAAAIPVRRSAYRQMALTAILAHGRPHLETSTEFHTSAGAFTLVPLPPGEGGAYRSSLVWMMNPADAARRHAFDDATFAHAVERQARTMLGAMRVEGPRGQFPITRLTAARLTGPRLALVGEAAHVFPPIGAQGLNLGLRDVAHLADCVAEARHADIGADAALDSYAAARRVDVALRGIGVDALNRSLLAGFMPIDALRGLGLIALQMNGPLRRAVMRAGIMPPGRPPRLMREPAVALGRPA